MLCLLCCVDVSNFFVIVSVDVSGLPLERERGGRVPQGHGPLRAPPLRAGTETIQKIFQYI